MRRDPVRINLLENSGGYLWQAAAWIVGAAGGVSTAPAALTRPEPPTVRDAMTAWRLDLSPSTRVRWADEVRALDACDTPLVSPRGTTVAIAVNTAVGSCVEVTPEGSAALHAGTQLAALPALTVCRSGRSMSDIVVALVRHGLVSVSDNLRVVEWGLLREPFVSVSRGESDTAVVTNQLNGRFFRVNKAAADMIDALSTPEPIGQPLSTPLQTLVAAGMLRVVGRPQ